MKFNKILDLVLNVILPVFGGGIIYYLHTKGFVKIHLSDGLWAYGFTSAILIIWDRKFHFFWIAIILASFIIFELLQTIHAINGTGDLFDVLVYFAFGGIALSTNKFFNKYLISYKNYPK